MKTRDMVLVALFAALTAIGAYLRIPTATVPFTLQILFVMYAGVLLGAKLGFLSQLVYVVMGLIGLPVFAGGMGGLSYIFKPSFGYLIGFMLCAYVVGKLTENIDDVESVKGFIRIFMTIIAGIAVVYIVGVPYMYFIINKFAEVGKNITFSTAIKWGFTPFIVFDLIKGIIVAATAVKVVPILKKSGYLGMK